MKLAGDDADGNLTLALGEGVTAGVEMRAERPHGFGELRIVNPDLGWSGEPATALDHRAIAILLLRGHLLIGDLSVTAKGWRIGHLQLPSRV